MTFLIEKLLYNNEGDSISDPTFEGEFVARDNKISFIGLRTDNGENMANGRGTNLKNDTHICIEFVAKDERVGIDLSFAWVAESIGKKIQLRTSAHIHTVELRFLIPALSPDKEPIKKLVVIDRENCAV